MSENICIKGVKVLEALMNTTKDEDRLNELQERSLTLYQQRYDRFGNSPKVRNLELTKTYKYWASRPSKHQELLDVFVSSFAVDSDIITNPNMMAYMDIMRKVKRQGIDLSDEQMISEYDKISSIVESRKSVTEDSDLYMDKIDAIFMSIVTLSCEKLEERFGHTVKDDYESVKAARIYAKLSVHFGCKDSELFNTALGYVIKYEPTLKLVLYKAKLSLAQKKLEDAETYFGKALSFDMDAETKSDVYIYLAKIYTLKEQKQNARSFALKSISANENKEAHSLIGNLYMSSFLECIEDKDIVQRRAVFIAAYDQFKLAGDTKNMEIAKASFPSAEEIHSNLYHVGQKMEIDCWFKEIVSLSKRSN
jgi:tetratricopeptide (TPR) repeat protein